jgi:hypothetical protein
MTIIVVDAGPRKVSRTTGPDRISGADVQR